MHFESFLMPFWVFPLSPWFLFCFCYISCLLFTMSTPHRFGGQWPWPGRRSDRRYRLTAQKAHPTGATQEWLRPGSIESNNKLDRLRCHWKCLTDLIWAERILIPFNPFGAVLYSGEVETKRMRVRLITRWASFRRKRFPSRTNMRGRRNVTDPHLNVRTDNILISAPLPGPPSAVLRLMTDASF